MRSKLLLIFLLSFFCFRSFSQCGPSVPTFTVNLTGNPGGTWNSPNISRFGNCCGTAAPETCIDFIITLDPAAVGINFNIISGAIPGGALFYQINCGPKTPLSSPICLTGAGPHMLTFCKPGNNANVYAISSIPPATGGTNIIVNDGCIDTLHATGFNASTVTWNSIYPGASGAYNSLLSCNAGCVDPIVTGAGSLPPYVDYVVCGQPASLCSFTPVCDTVRVTFNPTLAVTIVPINPTICFGQTSTTITANGSGGTPPYSYLWNSINPSQSINVGVGTYTVKLTDASGCPPTYATVTVTSFSVAITANAGPDDTVCSQSPAVILNGSVTGATGGVWSGGGGTYSPSSAALGAVYTPTAAEIAAGFVNLTLTTTGNGTCPAASDAVKIYILGFTGAVAATPVNVSCFGGSNGSATASVTGGIAPYSYSWSTVPLQTTATAVNLSIGTYTVTIQNGIGCTTQTTAVISQPLPLAVSSVITNVSCFAGANGTIALSPSGGTAPYTYAWSPGGQTAASISGLTAGTYSVTITDSKGCKLTANYTVTQPAALAITFTQTNVSCFNGSNGTANASVTGGTAPYTYSWSPAGGTAAAASGLTAGTYTVTVTDAKGCVFSSSVTITQPPVITAATAVTNETCNYLNNGTASALPAGGTPGYTYLWQPGSAASSSISGLASGTYTLTVTDSKGCSAIAFAVITEPAVLTVNMINQINVSCFGGSNGSVTAAPSGGTPAYSYSWSPGGANTATASGLAAGTYTVTVTDVNGCQIQGQAAITQPLLPLSASSTITNVSCSGGSNGSISVSPSGGTSPYTYLWSPGGQTASSISGQAAGTYTVTIKDSKGCSFTASYTITQPNPLAIAITSSNVSCFGGSNGSANSTVTGGTAPYSYSWSPSGGSSFNASNLIAGTYILTVTDAKGCVKTASVIITQPAVLSAVVSTVSETCDYSNDGSATVTASGGTSGYTYLWQPGSLTTSTITGLSSGTYTVTVTDSKGCVKLLSAAVLQPAPLAITFNSQINVSCFGGNNGSVTAVPSGGTPNYTYSWMPGGAITSSVSGLSAGTYTLTIKDKNNCTFQNTVTITQPAAPLAVSTSSTPVSCYGGSDGSVSASGSGGTGPYTYTWMPGSFSGQTISGLAAGTYTVTAADSKGCTKTNTVTVAQPAQMVLVTSTVNSNCGTPTGQASVTVTGGTGPYTYFWSPTGGTNATASSLLSGAYTVFVTDFNGCVASQYGNVNDNSGPSATIFSTINVSCYGGSDGAASVGVSGGTGPFTYNWKPFGGTSTTATGLTAGTYTVTVVDANGCQSNATTSPDITQPPPISIIITTANVSCFGGSNGTASASASGGTPDYTYQWLPGGSTGSSVSGLAAATYTVEVTDANSCVKTAPFTIGQPGSATAVSVSSTPVSCKGGSNGSVTAIASGGTSPYNYNWMPGNFSGSSISNLTAGTYTVTASDLNGCTITNTVNVTEPSAIVLAASSINSKCSSASGTAYVTASGGTAPYNYQWFPVSSSNDTLSNVLAGSYTVSVSDNNSCNATATVIVNDSPGPSASISSITNVSCNGGSDGSAAAAVTGGSAPFSYSWMPSGGNTSTGTGLSADSYTVNVSDVNGCLSSATAIVTEPSPISINVVTNNVSCFGGNNGSASASAFGGTPGYTYTWLPSGSSGNTITTLAAGAYTIKVTDANSCVQTVAFSITQPPALFAAIVSSSSVSCFGGNDGTASVSASGGTPFYKYNWLPFGGTNAAASGLSSGTYTVTVTDANSCSTFTTVTITQPSQALSASGFGSTTSCFGGSDGTGTVIPSGGTPSYSYLWSPAGGTGASAGGLSAGVYSILVTDSKGCQTNTSVTVTQPSVITASLTTVNPSCGFANGSISSMVSGGTGPYAYSWNPGGASSPGITGVGPGSYTVNITDAKNCSTAVSASLTNIAGPNASIASVTNVSCFGGNNGTAAASVSSGTPPYTYSWSLYGGNGITGTAFTAGSYTVTVTDALGCISTASAIITEPPALSVSISSISAVSCNGGNNGSIAVTGNGGTPGYTYSWSPVSSSSPTISNLAAGTYTVVVKDLNNCSASISAAVTQPSVLASSIGNKTNVTCFNGNNGSVFVTVSGGTIPYSYLWSDGQTGSTANNLAAGSYTVTVTDKNGCTSTSVSLITQPTQVITSAGQNDTICLGSSGTVTAAAAGGAGNYYYVWQPGSSVNSGTLNVSPAANTTYTVTAYDQIGCAGSADTVSAIVFSLTGANVDAIAYSPICPGQSTVVYVQTSGETGPLTYSWNNGLGTGPGGFLVTPAAPTTYVVTVTNSCGTVVKDSVDVVFSPPPTLALSSDTNEVCAPGSIQFNDNSVTGNVLDPIISWLWNFGDGSSSSLQDPSHIYAVPGNYAVTVTVTTSGGCTNNNGSAPIVISAHPYPTAAFTLNSTSLDLPYDVLVTDNLSTGASSYLWSFGDGGSSTLTNPHYLYSTVGIYQVQLIATNTYNCSDTAYSEVTTNADVIFPNAFTPNPDGSSGGSYDINSLTNDVFFPYTAGVVKFKFQIFNRWGELIFETFDIKKGWDGYYRGKLCQADVYIWKAYVKLNNGKEFNKTGDVTLLR